MSTTSTRLFLGFLAGSLSHLIFQDALLGILYVAHLAPALPWSLMPVPPLGVPASLNLAFWAGLWGLAYALLERRLTALLAWWSGGLVFGIAPLVVYWFVVLPLKGFGIGGGFHLAMVPLPEWTNRLREAGVPMHLINHLAVMADLLFTRRGGTTA
jgi:hypothetical protein